MRMHSWTLRYSLLASALLLNGFAALALADEEVAPPDTVVEEVVPADGTELDVVVDGTIDEGAVEVTEEIPVVDDCGDAYAPC